MSGNIERETQPVYSAEDASQGEVILKRPWQRAVFIGGLAAAVLLPIVAHFFMR